MDALGDQAIGIPIDATDLNFNVGGAGSLGIGAPIDVSSPAPGTDIMPGAGVGSHGVLDTSGGAFTLPSVPSLGGGASSAVASPSNFGGDTAFTNAYSGAGANIGDLVTAGGTTAPGSTTVGEHPTGGQVSITSKLSDWFVRAAIVILGFIFVAVGLRMFGSNESVVTAARNIGRS